MKYILMFIPGLIFLSCQKEATTKEPQPQPSQQEAFQQFSVTKENFEITSKFLKREVSFSGANPSLKNVRMFAYDANNRCTEIKIGTIDSSVANPVFNLSQTLTFKYNDALTLLPSEFYSIKTVFPNLVTHFYYKFNSNGLKILDSVRVTNQAGQPADRTIHYVYDNGKVYVTPVLSGFSMNNVPLDTLALLEAGNIERLISRIENSTGVTITTYTFTYDQNISPYNKLNIANSLYFESSALGIGYNVPLETHYMGVTTNNMTSWKTGAYIVAFNYVYDRDKYPVKKEMVLPGNSSPAQVTYFEY